jgi:hypothetical protein
MISRRVEAVRTTVVRAPADVTVAVVNDIASIHLTERKADTCEFFPETETTGTYRITGHVARVVPWRATFRYRLSPSGFHSETTAPVGRGWEISGGFVVESLDAHTSRLVHYEHYVLPPAMRWIKPALLVYMHASMRPELRDLARRAEAKAIVWSRSGRRRTVLDQT